MGKNKNKSLSKTPKNYIDLLYMTPNQITATEIAQIYNNSQVKIDLWAEMNVLEVELSNQNSIDFELLEIPFSNPSDVAFMKNRNIKSCFAIQLQEEDLALAKPLFEKLIHSYEGFICADTDDFKPLYLGNSSVK